MAELTKENLLFERDDKGELIERDVVLELIKDKPTTVRVDGDHYICCPNTNAYFKGFGGREFKILFDDGRKVVSQNLWHQGNIPESHRKRLPNNAKFL